MINKAKYEIEHNGQIYEIKYTPSSGKIKLTTVTVENGAIDWTFFIPEEKLALFIDVFSDIFNFSRTNKSLEEEIKNSEFFNA